MPTIILKTIEVSLKIKKYIFRAILGSATLSILTKKKEKIFFKTIYFK